MQTTHDHNHSASNFEFESEQQDTGDGYCRLVLRRRCRRNHHLYAQPDEIKVYERIRLTRINRAAQAFQQQVPPRNDLMYHLELQADESDWQDLRTRLLVDERDHWPFMQLPPFQVTGVQSGICICTNSPKNRAALRAVVEKHYTNLYKTLYEHQNQSK